MPSAPRRDIVKAAEHPDSRSFAFIRGRLIGFARPENDMATVKQIEANRRNALRSTGPKTPEGKAAVSLNSLRHGLRARTVVLPGEDPQEFQRLCDDLEAQWQPLTRTEQFYVEQMAVAQWKLIRMERCEASIFAQTIAATAQLTMLNRLWQAQCRMERSFASAQHELERIQISRNQAQQPQEPAPAAKMVPALQPAPAVASAAPLAASQPQPHGLKTPIASEFAPTPATSATASAHATSWGDKPDCPAAP